MKIMNVDFSLLTGHLFGHLNLDEAIKIEKYINSQSDNNKLTIIELAVDSPRIYQEFISELLTNDLEASSQIV